MAINPLIPISKTLGVVRGAAGLTLKTLGGISGALSESSRDKKIINSNISLIKKRRDELTKRKEKEDIISAPAIITQYKGPKTLSLSSTNQSFTSRILGFIGYLSAGWILSNMPTWVALGKEFTNRIYQTSDLLNGLGNDILQFTFDIGDVFKASFLNLKEFDFSDNSGRFKSSIDELSNGILDMGNKITEIFSILTQPFLNIPAPGTRSQRPSAYDTTPGPSGENPDFWLLSLISLYENSNPQGAADVAQSIYNRMGYSGRTARQEILATNQYEPVGKFGDVSAWNKVRDRESAIQHIKKHPGNGASISGLDKVASALTNRSMQQSAAKFVGNRPDFRSAGFEKTYNDMTNDITRYGQTFGFNRGSAYLGKSNKPASVPYFTGAPSTTQQLIPTTVIDEINVSGPSGGTSRVGRSGGRGEYLTRGGKHKGIDIGTSGQKGYYVALKQKGKVTFAGWNDGGYGYLVIIQSGNLEFFFAHLAKIMVKKGSEYNGETIGEIGNTGRSSGEHLHFEVRRVGGSHIDPNPYLNLLSIGRKFAEISRVSTPTQSLSPNGYNQTIKTSEGDVEINSASTANFLKLLQSISQDQDNRKILIIDDKIVSQDSPVLSSTGGTDISTNVNEFTLVNNFMKNKLLLDLAYL